MRFRTLNNYNSEFMSTDSYGPVGRGDARACDLGRARGSNRLRNLLPQTRCHHHLEEHVLRRWYWQLSVCGELTLVRNYPENILLNHYCHYHYIIGHSVPRRPSVASIGNDRFPQWTRCLSCIYLWKYRLISYLNIIHWNLSKLKKTVGYASFSTGGSWV